MSVVEVERTSRWTDCARCDWVADRESDRDARKFELADHAEISGHPLCVVCHRSLALIDPALACERCLTDARRMLARVGLLFDLLPAELARLHSGLGVYGGSGSSPSPGGNILVLMGPGSEGLAETGETSHDNDLPSVSFVLRWWAREWMGRQDEYEQLGHRPITIVRRASGYLERRARWAAGVHPGFPVFVGDLREVHAALERATGWALRHSQANASCFDCQGRLIRLDDPDRGLSDSVTCEQCRRQYTTSEYSLALRQVATQANTVDIDGARYASMIACARLVDRSERTVRDWARRGLIRTVRREGVVLGCVDDAMTENEARQRRSPVAV